MLSLKFNYQAMKILYLVCCCTLLLVCSTIFSAQAQFNADPFTGRVKWTHSFSKTKDLAKNEVITLTMTAEIDKGLHVFSVQPPKLQANLPTTFEFDAASKGCKLEGKLTEEGKTVKEYDDVFKTDIYYFKDKVVFKQQVKLTDSRILFMGTLKYQVCDEQGMCTSQTHRVEYKLEAQ